MKARRILVPEEQNGLYHVVSRVVDKRMIFGEAEKRRFRELMVAYAGFSGITVAAWCIMGNHFHMLLHVPGKAVEDPSQLPEDEILRRMSLIHDPGQMREFHELLETMRSPEERREWFGRFTRRMGDLPEFMKIVKQRFSQWYNGRNNRKGTLWEERYRSVLLEIQDEETLGHLARIVSAYIDLNPVRAGLVEDPVDYAWSGYSRAVMGDEHCKDGVKAVWGKRGGIRRALAEYRMFLYESGSEERQKEPGKKQDRRTGEWKRRAGISKEKVLEVCKRGGRLPLQKVVHLRLRYFVDGGVIGRRGFLEKMTGRAGVKEQGKPGTRMKHGEWGDLRVMRDLRVDVIG